jgi:Fe-S-cluster containining protein
VERHFNCTACGKCCYGWLPLTLKDALAHASRFPLAFVWTAVPQGTTPFAIASRIGTLIKYKRTKMAVYAVPTAYIPPSMPCPELTESGLCRIHESKPLRCRTMPFYPYREESQQSAMLIPRKGWLCDTSLAAPVVYRNHAIVEHTNFHLERNQIIEQAPMLRLYAEYMQKYSPGWVEKLADLSTLQTANVVSSLSSFLTAIKQPDTTALATQQLAVLNDFAAKTAKSPELADYHRNYVGWSKEMNYLAAR